MLAAWFVAACASGCVHYGTQNYNTVAVSASVTAPLPPGLENVPDIPAVGTRLDGARIRQALNGYGEWSQSVDYGAIWFPGEQYVGTDFVPYGTSGQWQVTDQGWYWQSSLPFGWVTFHYGRWVIVEQRWAWVPGALFAPAWVDWRQGEGWVGWAPLPPFGASFDAPYAFCRGEYLGEVDVWSRVVYGNAAMSIYPVTTAISPAYGYGGAVYAWGPPVGSISNVGGPVAEPPTAMPIATAWNHEVSARAGTPVGGTQPSGAQPVGTTTAPRGGSPTGTGQVAMAQPAGNQLTGTRGYGAEPRPHAVAPGMNSPMQPAPPEPMPRPMMDHMPSAPITSFGTTDVARGPEPVRIVADPDVAGTARYRTSDTVVLRSSIPEAPPRQTVSLGSVGGVGSGSYEPIRSTYNAPVGGGYPSPVYGGARGAYEPPVAAARGYEPPVSTSAGYAPPIAPVAHYGGISEPHYAAPAATYAPHEMGSYGAPHYSAPVGGGYAAPHYAAPAYHPSYGGGAVGYRRR